MIVAPVLSDLTQRLGHCQAHDCLIARRVVVADTAAVNSAPSSCLLEMLCEKAVRSHHSDLLYLPNFPMAGYVTMISSLQVV